LSLSRASSLATIASWAPAPSLDSLRFPHTGERRGQARHVQCAPVIVLRVAIEQEGRFANNTIIEDIGTNHGVIEVMGPECSTTSNKAGAWCGTGCGKSYTSTSLRADFTRLAV
jgi:hypothetical protein